MYGISECPQNTSRQAHQQTDVDNIVKVFSYAAVDIDNSSIKEFSVLENLIQNAT